MKTKTTLEFLDAVKAKHSLISDYQLSKFLNIRHSSISRYRSGKGSFDDATCLIIAEALGLDGGYVMMCIAAERAKDEKVKKAWEWSAQHLGGLAAALAVVAFLPTVNLSGDQFNIAFAGLAGADVMGGTLYIMSNSI